MCLKKSSRRCGNRHRIQIEISKATNKPLSYRNKEGSQTITKIGADEAIYVMSFFAARFRSRDFLDLDIARSSSVILTSSRSSL